jgi:orotidine-5'-phosphate decarboxylase
MTSIHPTQKLENLIAKERQFLCVGLDTDVKRLPSHLPANAEGMLEFNKAIIRATQSHCVSYKINTAFYEELGADGWDIMEETIKAIPETHFTIADAKRGDIGNTSRMYARAFFESMNVDAVTVAPYMGEDSVGPFLEYDHKTTIVLGLTSNPGSADFQREVHQDGRPFYQHVIERTAQWGNTHSLMFVIGATRSELFQEVRSIIPEHFLLVPGVGAQGGNLQEVYNRGANQRVGLLVNSSRGIIYASPGKDFADRAGIEAQSIAQSMSTLLS